MTTAHVYFADMPLATVVGGAANAVVEGEGHSPLDLINDDAIRQCRSISPNCPNSSNSPIPRYERNMGFFRQLSRRFGLRSNDDLVFSASNEDDNQSSSTDSCSSHTPPSSASLSLSASSTATAAAAAAASNAAASLSLTKGETNKKDTNTTISATTACGEYISCASSECSSTVDIDEQLQQLQLQLKKQQQRQQIGNETETANNDLKNNEEDDETDNNENTEDANKTSSFIKERKSFARSSLSRLHRRSTTSIRRAFEAFSLSSRSLSCSGATPPPILPTSATSATSTITGTPIKSALKSSSNLELNKRPHSSNAMANATKTNSCLKKSSCSSSSCSGSANAKTSSFSSSTSASSSSSKIKTKPPPQRILRQPVSYTYLKGISGLPTQRVPRNSVCCQYVRR